MHDDDDDDDDVVWWEKVGFNLTKEWVVLHHPHDLKYKWFACHHMSKPNFALCWKEECNFKLNFSTCVMGIMPVTVVWMIPTNSVSGIEQKGMLPTLWRKKLI